MDGRVHGDTPARADVPGGHGEDDGGGGGGRAAVPHLRRAADVCGGCRAGAAVHTGVHVEQQRCVGLTVCAHGVLMHVFVCRVWECVSGGVDSGGVS